MPPPRSNHACPPRTTMHAPQSNHACPPRATMHTPQATMHTPPQQPHMPPPPWEQPCMPPLGATTDAPRSNHAHPPLWTDRHRGNNWTPPLNLPLFCSINLTVLSSQYLFVSITYQKNQPLHGVYKHFCNSINFVTRQGHTRQAVIWIKRVRCCCLAPVCQCGDKIS